MIATVVLLGITHQASHVIVICNACSQVCQTIIDFSLGTVFAFWVYIIGQHSLRNLIDPIKSPLLISDFVNLNVLLTVCINMLNNYAEIKLKSLNLIILSLFGAIIQHIASM